MSAVEEVDELHAECDAGSVNNLPRAPLSARSVNQSDSMRNLLIVESTGRSTIFLIESFVALLAAASLLILSMAVVIVLPLMYSEPAEKYPIRIDVHNCWVYGLWLPFLVVIWATLMLKAARTGYTRYFSMFYCLCALGTICCTVVVVLRCVYYANGWFQELVDQPNLTSKRQFSIQIACDILCLVLLLEGVTLLCVYARAFCRECHQSNSEERQSPVARNMFV